MRHPLWKRVAKKHSLCETFQKTGSAGYRFGRNSIKLHCGKLAINEIMGRVLSKLYSFNKITRHSIEKWFKG